MNSKDKLEIYVDGSCRANGKDNAVAGIGIVVYFNGSKVLKFSGIVDAKTNNQAEYLAVIYALKLIKQFDYKNHIITLYSDSSLVVNQLKGDWRIKKKHLQDLYNVIMFLLMMYKDEYFNYFNIKWIKREQNREADELAQSITEYK